MSAATSLPAVPPSSPLGARTWGAELAAALSRAQGHVRGVEKDSRNEFHRYKYASAESLIEEARGSLAFAGLAVISVGWSVEPPVYDGGPFRMRVPYLLTHESGQYLEITTSTPILPEKGRPDDKAEATSLTYNLGYTLRGLLLLSREDETTAVDKRDDRAHEPRQAPPAPAPPVASELGKADAFDAETEAATTLEQLRTIPARVKAADLPPVLMRRVTTKWYAKRRALQAAAQGVPDPDPNNGAEMAYSREPGEEG